ncbi:MAG TPA: DUF1707 domain-containing protein [Streptosporangiaceae bacterium]|nr:DUF1707 domain-containing protein [Streptosporangiaceae bacterium]
MDTRPASYPAADLRVSDADRDRAVSELSEHFQAGRLTLDEFDERSGRALSAKTARDLRGLFTDLPPGGTPAKDAEQPTRSAPPARRSSARLGRLLVALPIGLFIAIAALASGYGHGHHAAFGGLVPLAIVCLVCVRSFARRNASRI